LNPARRECRNCCGKNTRNTGTLRLTGNRSSASRLSLSVFGAILPSRNSNKPSLPNPIWIEGTAQTEGDHGFTGLVSGFGQGGTLLTDWPITRRECAARCVKKTGEPLRPAIGHHPLGASLEIFQSLPRTEKTRPLQISFFLLSQKLYGQHGNVITLLGSFCKYFNRFHGVCDHAFGMTFLHSGKALL